MKVFSFDNIAEQREGPLRLQYVEGMSQRTVAFFKDVGYIAGPKGTMKTTWLQSIQAAGLSGEMVNGFRFDLGDRVIVYADTELPEMLFDRNQIKVFDYAGLPHEPHNQYYAMSLTAVDDYRERLERLAAVIKHYGKWMGMLILDRFDHFMEDPARDTAGARKLIGWLKRIADENNTIVLGLTHTTETRDKLIDNQFLYGAAGRELQKAAAFGFITEKTNRRYSLIPKDTKYGETPPRLTAVVNDKTERLELLPFMPF